MSRTTIKNGITCEKNEGTFRFSFTGPLKKTNLLEILEKNLFYDLLYHLNNDCIEKIEVERKGDLDTVLIMLFINYLVDDNDEDTQLYIPLVNKTTITGSHVEIQGQHNATFITENAIKLTNFHMTLDFLPEAWSFVLKVDLTEKMNILKSNAFCLTIQKIFGRLKTYSETL